MAESIRRPQSNSSTIIQRVQAVILLEAGIAAKIVAATIELSEPVVYRWRRVAIQRGYDSTISRVLKEEHLVDAPRSGRPFKVTAEVEQAILNNVRGSKNGREKTSVVCIQISLSFLKEKNLTIIDLRPRT